MYIGCLTSDFDVKVDANILHINASKLSYSSERKGIHM